MDPAQIILFIVIIILTILFVVIGIQVFYVLKEFRATLTKTNQILDKANEVASSVSNPINALSGVLAGVKTGNLIASLIKKFTSKDKE